MSRPLLIYEPFLGGPHDLPFTDSAVQRRRPALVIEVGAFFLSAKRKV
jgi:hypothetical protein